MTWNEFYEKLNDWAVSTAVSKISSFANIGAPDEIVEAINIIAYEDEKGATRLLNKAINADIKFSGENLTEMVGLCSEESFQKALLQSADKFTSRDLEDLYGSIDDEIIIKIAKQYGIPAPEDIAEDYEEELCTDTSVPVTWDKFYDRFYDWSHDYAIARSRSITNFGDEDEVIEVTQELFGVDEQEASLFVKRALDFGVQFHADNLIEVSGLCNEETTRQAVLLSSSLMNEECLEELYGIVDDEILLVAAKNNNWELPEELREEAEEAFDEPDLKFEISTAIESADYALDCLVQAQEAMYNSGNISVIDMLSKHFLPSFMKYSSLEETEQYIRTAQGALENLNCDLRVFKNHKNVKLKYARLNSAIDMWFDNDLMDCLVHLQINKVQKRIRRAITQVEAIRRELERI